MKAKAALAGVLLFLGAGASLGVGATRDHGGDDNDQGTTTATKTVTAPACVRVALAGQATAGSVAFTVQRTSRGATDLVGKSVTLALPKDARVVALACRNGSTLTLSSLRVALPKAHNDQGEDH